MSRNKLFDEARGIAIVFMVMANSFPLLDPNVHVDFWFRLLSSFAAPTFIVISGAMVALTAHRHNFLYFFKRGLFIILIGILIDVFANKIVPFQGFDVLYLIGIMTPLAFFANKLKSFYLFLLIALLLLVTIGLQNLLGYQAQVSTIYLFNTQPKTQAVVWKHWIIDGWFPLFPWVSIGFCGILYYRFYKKISGFFTIRFLLCMLFLIGIGIVINNRYPSPFLLREGYVELFYPPSLSFLLGALGFVGFLLAICELCTKRLRFNWFQTLGSMALAMYALHLLVIGNVLSPIFQPISNFVSFYSIYAGHLAFLFLCARMIKHVREAYSGMPVMLRWLLGK